MRRPSQGGPERPNSPSTPTPLQTPSGSSSSRKISARVTRLAPSPTGALHLGNARTFLINWALARRNGWDIALRIEDLDGPRIKDGAAESLVDTLRWLGLDWDEGPLVQSRDLSPYIDAMRALAEGARAYPCILTRAQIEEAASAPHERSVSVESRAPRSPEWKRKKNIHPTGGTGGESRFPSALRQEVVPRAFDDPQTNWRFVVPDAPVEFVDVFCGPQRPNPAHSVGDFVVWTKRAQPSYQLAVVVDDHRQGVTDVVRGDDLLDSAARQVLLYRALGFAPEPMYTHLPLVVGTDGRRLAKRHGDTRVDHYRARGVPVERIIGLIAFWSGVQTVRAPMSPGDFVGAFNLENLPRSAAAFTNEDDQWLLHGTTVSRD